MIGFLFWAPRVLCIAFTVFLSLFALDVFGEGYSFWNTILALMIHLIPSAIIVAVLVVSWRWEWVGGILFIALGVLYRVLTWGKLGWGTNLVIGVPLILVGVLFLINWCYRAEIRPQP